MEGSPTQVHSSERAQLVASLTWFHIPISEIVKYLTKAIKLYPKKAIISVGSGDGFLESLLREQLNRKIITVEQIDRSKDRTNCSLPASDYQTVDQMIRRRPKLVDNCILLLPSPENFAINKEYPEECATDLYSIKRLKPKAVIILHDAAGSLGSENLHCWLDSIGPIGFRARAHKDNQDMCPFSEEYQKLAALHYPEMQYKPYYHYSYAKRNWKVREITCYELLLVLAQELEPEALGLVLQRAPLIENQIMGNIVDWEAGRDTY
jgi:hypothetical protein